MSDKISGSEAARIFSERMAELKQTEVCRPVPNDPVLRFICDEATRQLVMNVANSGQSSSLSYSRMTKIGYRLLVLRCAQIGLEPPSRSEAEAWAK
jgi:hypothetical protein